MKTRAQLLSVLVLVAAVGLTGCAGGRKAQKGEDYIPHENYGGCQIQGRHYHNTHVFIGSMYEPSLSEWLKY